MAEVSTVVDGWYQDSGGQEMTASMEDVIGRVLAMGHDPLSKKNGTTIDYLPTPRHDTYDFIEPEQFDLSGRAVFITGASRGFGKAYAISYAKAGASKIGIGARSDCSSVIKEVEEAAKAAGRAKPQVVSVKLDVTDAQSVTAAAAEIKEVFGRCDILINNSGFLDAQVKITEADPVEWWKGFEVNILGAFLVSRAFMPLILAEKDSLKTIVNISSMWALTYWPESSAYQMTKLALVRFSQILCSEYGDQGILSFSLHPGSTMTELAKPLKQEIAQFLIDKPELGGDTIVWLTAERREWLAGRFMNAQWDMQELSEKKDRIVKEDHLKMRLSVGLA